MSRNCWGIYREREHSPGRLNDDAAIMDAVAAALAERGLFAELLLPEEADSAFADPAARMFVMCEREGILARLDEAAAQGAVIVNPPSAIRNTYRVRTIERFRLCGVPAPASWVIPTSASAPPPVPRLWVKRPDFHATEPNDVLAANSRDEWHAALASFAARGIGEVVVQAHARGDLIKFYGVVGAGEQPNWFHYFYHRNQIVSGHAFTPQRAQGAAFAAASAIGLAIFGGDAIVGADGQPLVIDINAWPSFALCRAEAADAIAGHLAEAFSRPLPSETLHSKRLNRHDELSD